MGAASSVSLNNVYISKGSTNKYITMLLDKLQTLDRSFVNEKEYSIQQSNFIIICITPDTIRTQAQVAEINYAWDSKKPILYIMTNKNYTPLCNPELNSIIKNDRWISCFDEKSVDGSFAQISYLLERN